MKKKAKQMTALGIAAVVLAGAYVGLTLWNHYSENKKEEEEAEEEEAAKRYLCEMESPTSLQVTENGETFSFTYDSDNETWMYDKDEHFPVLQSKVTAITSKMESLLAERELTETDSDLSIYGLDDPQYKVVIADADGNTTTLSIGDSSDASGDYYVQADGKEYLYTVSSTFVSKLSLTEDDFLATETFPTITSSGITQLTLTGADSSVKIWSEQREVEIEETSEAETEAVSEEETEAESAEESTAAAETASAEEETGEIEAETETEAEPVYETVWFVSKDGGEATEVDTDSVTALFDSLVAVTYSDCADYYAEDDEKAEYGLDEASDPDVITVEYTSGDEDKTFTLTLGAVNEDGTSRYCAGDGSTMVNLTDEETIDGIISSINGIDQIVSE